MNAEKIADRAAVIFTGLVHGGVCPPSEYEERAIIIAIRLENAAERKIAARYINRAQRKAAESNSE